MDGERLDAMLAEIRTAKLPIDSVTVIRHGYVVLDRSFGHRLRRRLGLVQAAQRVRLAGLPEANFGEGSDRGRIFSGVRNVTVERIGTFAPALRSGDRLVAVGVGPNDDAIGLAVGRPEWNLNRTRDNAPPPKPPSCGTERASSGLFFEL
jgi:hypothetical protein